MGTIRAGIVVSNPKLAGSGTVDCPMRSELAWPVVTGLVMAGSNGCDYWRSIVPFEVMNKNKFKTYIATYGEALRHKPDVLVCNRLGLGNDNAALSLIRQSHNAGIAVVVDNDDD